METQSALIFALIVLLLVFFASVFGLFVYSGLFAPVEIRAQRPPFGNLHIAYKFARGSYKNAGMLFTQAHSIAPELATIGVYYDDPQQVERTADLRYCVGVVLPEADDEKKKYVDAFLADGFKEARLPAVDHAVMTTFPFKNTLSIFIGVAKVYPQLAAFVQESRLCAHPMIEIYKGDEIIFMSPLSRQDEFYVEESHEEPNSNVEDESQMEDNQTEEPAEAAAAENGPIGGVSDGEVESSAGSSFEELQH